MSVYDNNWVSYAMYTVCTVESSADYGCVEKGAMQGIGIAQWTNDRSWQLLNLMSTDYPATQSLFPLLWDSIKPGTSSWGEKVFTQSQANEISKALVTTEGVATQDKLWLQDCTDDYIPLLRDRCSLTDPWGAIFALSIYHQSPRAYWQVYNGVGDGTKSEWYTGAINNGIVGKYKTRQNTIKKLLDEWDGESGKSGFGTKVPTETEGGDNNPNTGNPDDTVADTKTPLGITSLRKIGNDFLLNLNINNKPSTLTFWKASNGTYFPKVNSETVEGETETEPIPPPPEQTGTNEDIDWIMTKMRDLEGTLQYSQAQSLRTNIPGGYADCSGLVWWLYKQRGYTTGTSTWTQVDSGDLIIRGDAGQQPDESKMQLGDLVLFRWPSGYQHVELYDGAGYTWGHGGNPYYGPTRKALAGQVSACEWWMVRRIIDIN